MVSEVLLFLFGGLGALLTVYLATQEVIPEFRALFDIGSKVVEVDKLRVRIRTTQDDIDSARHVFILQFSGQLSIYKLGTVGATAGRFVLDMSYTLSDKPLFWGVAMGSLTAFLGSIVPSLAARSVKVSEVFAKVA